MPPYLQPPFLRPPEGTETEVAPRSWFSDTTSGSAFLCSLGTWTVWEKNSAADQRVTVCLSAAVGNTGREQLHTGLPQG